MPISNKIDETFREIMQYAIRNEVEELQRMFAEAGEKATGQIFSLAVQASAYITIDVSEGWPDDGDLKEVAKITARSRAKAPVAYDEVYTYLSRVVFGRKKLEVVFPDPEKAAMVPLFTLANQVIAFNPPQGEGWNEWLDVIETGIEAAEKIPDWAVPAAMYRYKRD